MPNAEHVIPKASAFCGPNLSIKIPNKKAATPQVNAWKLIAMEKTSFGELL